LSKFAVIHYLTVDKNFSTDKPISSKEEDRFQRYPFSERIAKTIIERESEDCITIGIYGAWGEGKTSVLNFIETELNKNEQIIIIKFNPWRYNDENSLLLQFFQKLATSLKTNLKTKKEKAGELLRKYGKLLDIEIPGIGNPSKTMESAGELLGKVDIETLKERIGQIIKANNRKIVVFIDDIDRLDKNEIHSIFRLVKLTADFSNTIYILSFDEQMVSAAIGERFGEGNQKSGQSFLEKIIQVPLEIPIAQTEALKTFCFELAEKAIESNNISIDEHEVTRYVNNFIHAILPKLDTPRLAVRYGNTLSFSLPLLYDEVNTVDLMLIEAIKIFYPNYYEFIKTNPEFFVGNYSDSFGTNQEKVKEIKDYLENLSKGLLKRQTRGINSLIEELFPKLRGVIGHYHSGTDEEWFKKKRICSAKYFNRYFTYAVIKGEVSDIAFQNFISSVLAQDEAQNIAAIKKLVEQSSPDNFVQKLRTYEKDFSWDESVRLATAISKCSEIFPESVNDAFLIGFGSPRSQASIFISQLIKKHSVKTEALRFTKKLITEATSFNFIFELLKWMRSGDDQREKKFTKDQLEEVENILLERAMKEAGATPLFEKFPERCDALYKFWANKNPKDLNKHIAKLFSTDKTKCVELLNALTPIMRSSAYKEPYKSNFSRDRYDYFISIFDKEVFKKYIFLNFTEEEVNDSNINWEEHEGEYQTDLNIARQFMHWYNKSAVQEATL